MRRECFNPINYLNSEDENDSETSSLTSVRLICFVLSRVTQLSSQQQDVSKSIGQVFHKVIK